MKKIFYTINTLFIILFFSFTATAQDYSKVDEKVKTYPKSFSDTQKLAERIAKDFSADDEKARAIFTWIALNVKYDLPAYGKGSQVAFSYASEEEKIIKQKKFKNDLALKTLKTKKGVCEGYSTLFEILCTQVGLESVIVSGTSKSHPAHIGKVPAASDHAWNAVKIDGNWKLIDVTWAAGTVSGKNPAFTFRFNDAYFFTDPEVFFLNHYPDDEKWLFTNKTKQDFADLPLYYGPYIQSDMQFLTPEKGSFINKRSSLVLFKIKNLKPTDGVAYTFSRDNIINEVAVKQNGDISEFEVVLDNKSNGYLTVYINQRAVAAYRISRG